MHFKKKTFTKFIQYETFSRSYASMIRLAISSSPNGKMTLNEIYNYICNAFPYYKEAGKGWMVRLFPFCR